MLNLLWCKHMNERINNYLDKNGLINTFPSKKKNKIIVLNYIIKSFDENKVYNEKEVNDIINNLTSFKDQSTIRRELYDNYLIDRSNDGRQYWVHKQ